MFIESLAEDASTSDRAEWLVSGRWYKKSALPAGSQRKHWRLRGLNTVLLFNAAKTAKVGQEFTAKVPQKPFSVYTDAAKKCADDDDHIGLDQTVYWYRWQPEQASCTIPLQDLKVTVSKVFPKTQSTVYPEFDQLTADKKLTTVILFGQIDDGAITENETGMRNLRQYANWLKDANYTKKTATVGERYERTTANGTLIRSTSTRRRTSRASPTTPTSPTSRRHSRSTRSSRGTATRCSAPRTSGSARRTRASIRSSSTAAASATSTT